MTTQNVEELLELLVSRNEFKRRKGVEALAKLMSPGDRELRALINTKAKDSDPIVRDMAAKALELPAYHDLFQTSQQEAELVRTAEIDRLTSKGPADLPRDQVAILLEIKHLLTTIHSATESLIQELRAQTKAAQELNRAAQFLVILLVVLSLLSACSFVAFVTRSPGTLIP